MITRILIALNVLAFLWEIRVGGPGVISGNIPSGTAIDNGLLVPAYVLQQHQYYRIFTAAFLHGSVFHIGLNMLSLYWLGRFIEVALGPVRMLAVYVIAIIASGVSVVLFSPPYAATLGASGAIFGLFGALFAIGLKLGPRGTDLVRSNIGILVLNLAFSFAVPGISWQAHVGGLIVGFLATYLMFWPPKPVYASVVDRGSGVEYQSELETPDDRY
ncbi:MAG TPA: rhomboid family intramembrane serine protease [Candidatus Baltobacteraceae bacterium]|nr:rhomboid family intramembrane serine protease [Candidatus Baltobacteraceae bacterium]